MAARTALGTLAHHHNQRVALEDGGDPFTRVASVHGIKPRPRHLDMTARIEADPDTGDRWVAEPRINSMTISRSSLRVAIADDGPQLLRLWGLLFDQDEAAVDVPWQSQAREWFARYVDDSSTARFPVVDVGGDIVATAIGTLEMGVPNPMCPRGRTVRLANVITRPEHRGCGYGTSLVRDVIEWARSMDADRVDLSATKQGTALYARAGFVLTSAPRMKLVF